MTVPIAVGMAVPLLVLIMLLAKHPRDGRSDPFGRARGLVIGMLAVAIVAVVAAAFLTR